MRVDSRELPLSAIPLCQLLPCHLRLPRPTLSLNLYVKGCFDCTIGAFHMSIPAGLLSFRMRSREGSAVDFLLHVCWHGPLIHREHTYANPSVHPSNHPKLNCQILHKLSNFTVNLLPWSLSKTRITTLTLLVLVFTCWWQTSKLFLL